MLLSFVAVPYSSLSGSPSGLKRSSDNEFVLLTRSEINILTPALGVVADPLSRIAPLHKPAKGKERARSELPLFRTSFVVEKKDILEWAGWSNDDRAFSPAMGMSEPFWRDAVWSPSAISALGGCVLAALTTNHEVLLFEAPKNPHKGEWPETFDLTAQLVRTLLPQADTPLDAEVKPTLGSLATNVLECQSTAIAWSPPVPGSSSDFSLLVVGHKSGHLSVWRRWAGKMEILHRYRPSDSAGWITLLSFSPWLLRKSGDQTLALSCLAVADSSGAVWNLELTQDVSAPREARAVVAGGGGGGREEDVDMLDLDTHSVSAATPVELGIEDGRAASQFCWVVRPGETEPPELVYTKLGTVYSVRLELNPSGETWFRVANSSSLDLPPIEEASWDGTTPFASCSGIVQLPNSKDILLVLSCASFYTLTLGGENGIEPSEHPLPLTTTARDLFLKERKEGTVGRNEGERIVGLMVVAEKPLELGWVSQYDNQVSMAFVNDSKVRSNFVLLELDESTPEDRLAGFDDLLNAGGHNSRLISLLVTFDPFLHYVSDTIRDDAFVHSLLQRLAEEPPPSSNAVVNELFFLARSSSGNVAEEFVGSLYGEEGIEGLRVRETVARLIQMHPHLPASLVHEALVAQTTLARQLAKETTARLARVLDRVKARLSDTEARLLGRLLIASTALQSDFKDDLPQGQVTSPDALAISFGSEECPACAATIPVVNVRKAMCERGHEWDRCSITLAILVTVNTRTCVCCGRKALLAMDGGKGAAPGADDALGVSPHGRLQNLLPTPLPLPFEFAAPRPTQPSLIATFPPELILHIEELSFELVRSTSPFKEANDRQRLKNSIRGVCVAWFAAVAGDVAEVAVSSNKGCAVLLRYLEKEGLGGSVRRLTIGSPTPDARRSEEGRREAVPSVVRRLIQRVPNLTRLAITVDSGNIDFLAYAPNVVDLTLRATPFPIPPVLDLAEFSRYPHVDRVRLLRKWGFPRASLDLAAASTPLFTSFACESPDSPLFNNLLSLPNHILSSLALVNIKNPHPHHLLPLLRHASSLRHLTLTTRSRSDYDGLSTHLSAFQDLSSLALGTPNLNLLVLAHAAKLPALETLRVFVRKPHTKKTLVSPLVVLGAALRRGLERERFERLRQIEIQFEDGMHGPIPAEYFEELAAVEEMVFGMGGIRIAAGIISGGEWREVARGDGRGEFALCEPL